MLKGELILGFWPHQCGLGVAQMVHEGKCDSLKRLKQAVDVVGKGTECGIMLQVRLLS